VSTDATGPAVRRLALTEAGRYARHPLFLIGLVATIALSIPEFDGNTDSYLLSALTPGLFIGVFGIVVMYRLTRGSDRLAETSGAPALGMRARTAALAWAVMVPFGVGLIWCLWTIWRYQNATPPPYGLPFGDIGDAWAYGWIFALGAVSCAGGPIIGLDLARWFPRRGIAVVVAVVIVIVSMGINVAIVSGVTVVERLRVFWPFTWFGGPSGIEGDADRMVILPGSPLWYAAYLVALCALGILVALYRDREQPRERLRVGIIATAALALVLGVLAMTTGVQEPLINPNPSPAAVASSP
jgi:hypothetical protein